MAKTARTAVEGSACYFCGEEISDRPAGHHLCDGCRARRKKVSTLLEPDKLMRLKVLAAQNKTSVIAILEYGAELAIASLKGSKPGQFIPQRYR